MSFFFHSMLSRTCLTFYLPGNQARIVFSLVGEPPFTFTYQRSEPPTKKGAKPGKVLETHTVSGILDHEYSIYTALEGLSAITSRIRY